MNVSERQQTDAAWAPLLGAAYALLAVAGTLFLAAASAHVDSLLVSLGSVAPASDRIGRFVGLAIIGISTLFIATTIIRGRVTQIASESIGPRVLAIMVIALVLMAPPVQWILFGRPDPMSAHLHKMEGMEKNSQCAETDHSPASVARHADEHDKATCGTNDSGDEHDADHDHAEH